ncbi:unnamed protein product [Ostreobium quekettii]|uniref:Uncharacterized protein n=1 Tax=Ostreobium quekettii TaxID=121088 RepID=A0A8S1IMJ0_9CHLO|nr:unnamed protein product [Ostreobium quekettii]|eukprot:evm.model.scf_897.2 EVM.evm.TU.scf_897.2   scf_897:6487-15490(+)
MSVDPVSVLSDPSLLAGLAKEYASLKASKASVDYVQWVRGKLVEATGQAQGSHSGEDHPVETRDCGQQVELEMESHNTPVYRPSDYCGDLLGDRWQCPVGEEALQTSGQEANIGEELTGFTPVFFTHPVEEQIPVSGSTTTLATQRGSSGGFSSKLLAPKLGQSKGAEDDGLFARALPQANTSFARQPEAYVDCSRGVDLPRDGWGRPLSLQERPEWVSPASPRVKSHSANGAPMNITDTDTAQRLAAAKALARLRMETALPDALYEGDHSADGSGGPKCRHPPEMAAAMRGCDICSAYSGGGMVRDLAAKTLSLEEVVQWQSQQISDQARALSRLASKLGSQGEEVPAVGCGEVRLCLNAQNVGDGRAVADTASKSQRTCEVKTAGGMFAPSLHPGHRHEGGASSLDAVPVEAVSFRDQCPIPDKSCNNQILAEGAEDGGLTRQQSGCTSDSFRKPAEPKNAQEEGTDIQLQDTHVQLKTRDVDRHTSEPTAGQQDGAATLTADSLRSLQENRAVELGTGLLSARTGIIPLKYGPGPSSELWHLLKMASSGGVLGQTVVKDALRAALKNWVRGCRKAGGLDGEAIVRLGEVFAVLGGHLAHTQLSCSPNDSGALPQQSGNCVGKPSDHSIHRQPQGLKSTTPLVVARGQQTVFEWDMHEHQPSGTASPKKRQRRQRGLPPWDDSTIIDNRITQSRNAPRGATWRGKVPGHLDKGRRTIGSSTNHKNSTRLASIPFSRRSLNRRGRLEGTGNQGRQQPIADPRARGDGEAPFDFLGRWLVGMEKQMGDWMKMMEAKMQLGGGGMFSRSWGGMSGGGGGVVESDGVLGIGSSDCGNGEETRPHSIRDGSRVDDMSMLDSADGQDTAEMQVYPSRLRDARRNRMSHDRPQGKPGSGKDSCRGTSGLERQKYVASSPLRHDARGTTLKTHSAVGPSMGPSSQHFQSGDRLPSTGGVGQMGDGDGALQHSPKEGSVMHVLHNRAGGWTRHSDGSPLEAVAAYEDLVERVVRGRDEYVSMQQEADRLHGGIKLSKVQVAETVADLILDDLLDGHAHELHELCGNVCEGLFDGEFRAPK